MSGRIVDNVRLPEDIERGARIGFMWNTSVVTLANGKTTSNRNWQDCLVQVDCGYGMMDKKNPDDLQDSYERILEFFMARNGRHRGFLFRNPIDHEATLEPLKVISEDDRTYQLGILYDDYFRRITRPDVETLVIYNDETLLAEADYSLGELGVVTLNEALDVGTLSASFQFDIAMVFEGDSLFAAIQHIRAGEFPDINLIQVQE
ncbi:MAG TPA: DUF2460 domain-containing protein [bacterium]|nr:DUF2460 domain-containing protein [bacterium]